MVDFEKLDEVDGIIVEDYLAGNTELQDWMANTIWDIQEKLGLLAIPTDKKKIPLVLWSKKNNFTGFKSKEDIMTLIDKKTRNPEKGGEAGVPCAIALLTTNQIIGMDNDDAKDYEEILLAYSDHGIEVEKLYKEITRQGHHTYVALDRELTEEETKLIDDIKGFLEFKHQGNMIMIAGSYHKSGKKLYKELNHTIWDIKNHIVSADKFLEATRSLRKRKEIDATTWDIIKPNAPRNFKYTTEQIKQAFIDQNKIEDILSKHGYIQVGNRFMHPNGDSNTDGSVDILPNGTSFHFGDNDPLKGKGAGKDDSSLTSFSVYCEMEHHGDFKEAIKAASEEMGMNVYEDGTSFKTSQNSEDKAEFHEMNEEDTAQWFCDVHGSDLLYSEKQKAWFIWNGRYWTKDYGNTIINTHIGPFINKTMKEYANTLSDEQPEDKRMKSPRKNFHKYIQNTLNLRPMTNIEKIARAKLDFDCTRFDTNNDQLCFNNGVVDLKTGKLMPHKRNYHHTSCIPYNYKPKAECPVWQGSINKSTSDSDGTLRPNMAKYLQKCYGYAITGEIIEQCIFLLFGQGDNGKSFMTEYVKDRIGGFGHTAMQEILLEAKHAKANGFAESSLQGVRLAYVSEIAENEHFNSAKAKRLTNKTVIADRKYERQIEFKSTHKLFIDCNHMPIIKETDHGTWRRIRLIPFDYQLKKHEIDNRIDEKWDAEIEGILAWLVEGARRWYAEGLGNPPNECQVALSKFKKDSDTLFEFIDDCLELTDDPKAYISSEDMFKVYKKWASDSGYSYTLTKQKLKKKLLERGLKDGRDSKTKGMSGAYVKDGAYPVEKVYSSWK